MWHCVLLVLLVMTNMMAAVAGDKSVWLKLGGNGSWNFFFLTNFIIFLTCMKNVRLNCNLISVQPAGWVIVQHGKDLMLRFSQTQ